MAENKKDLHATLERFIGRTAKSNVAVIVPMFGYWKDMESQQLNEETLKISLDRVYSYVHNLYIIFVAEQGRLSKEVSSTLVGKQKAGNCMGVAMEKGASYADYIRAGFDTALNDPAIKAQYLVVVNPWVLLQHNAIDIIVDRVNHEDVKVVCGFDVKNELGKNASWESFEGYKPQIPKEYNDSNFDFMAMKRLTAEMVSLDTAYKTHYFLAVDFMQGVYSRGYSFITSQRVPIFPFDVDWKEMEKNEDYQHDKQHFISKWRFDPSIQY